MTVAYENDHYDIHYHQSGVCFRHPEVGQDLLLSFIFSRWAFTIIKLI